MDYIDRDQMNIEASRSLEQGKCTDAMAYMLMEMHDRILTHRNWQGYHQELKDEMKSYSLMRCIKGLKNFTPDKGDAFAYFTSAIFMNYLSVVKKYYRQKEKEEQIINEMKKEQEFQYGMGHQLMNGKRIWSEEEGI